MRKKFFIAMWGKKKEYVNFASSEVVLAFISAFILSLMMIFLNVYYNFSAYLNFFDTATIYIFQALIGMLGTILAGISIIIFLLNSNGFEKIKVDSEKSYRMLLSFVFLSLNIVISIFLFLLVNFLLHTPSELIHLLFFYTFSFLVTYHFFFILFYTIALIYNIVTLFRIDAELKYKVKEQDEYTRIANEIYSQLFRAKLNGNDLSNISFEKEINGFISNLKCSENIKKQLHDEFESKRVL